MQSESLNLQEDSDRFFQTPQDLYGNKKIGSRHDYFLAELHSFFKQHFIFMFRFIKWISKKETEVCDEN